LTTIGFAGLSHLGIVSSAVAADLGFDTVAYDSDASLCSHLTAGEPPIQEPGLAELLAKVTGKIDYTSSAKDLDRCDLLYLSLDVDTDAAGHSDLSRLETLTETVLPCLKSGCTIVVLSQVPPGYTQQMSLADHVQLQAGHHPLYCQVETLIFGRAVERAGQPERYIIGCQDPQAPLSPELAEFLGAFGCPILPMRYESAELTKISINMFLAASVAMSNSLAELCESVGADWSEIAPALRLDRRIGEHAYLAPGLGIAGGNLERDLVSVLGMAREHGTDCAVVESILTNSKYRRHWVLRNLHQSLPIAPSSATIALWGLAYKADTKSTKNAPSLALIAALSGTIRAYDPVVDPADVPAEVSRCLSPLDSCIGADALVIMTPWEEFRSVDLGRVREAMKGDLVVDPFGFLQSSSCAEHGLKHCRIGVSADEREQ
jgi:UDPglucose 6-dehydrogenase